jgi:hypothetical protein
MPVYIKADGREPPPGYVADGDYYKRAPSPEQVYALRIWSGQSPDLPRAERIARVTAGMAGQGMSMEGVVLPATHDSKPETV